MAITAADVMKLRKMTSAGMMDCKKALEEAAGDFNKAIEIIREKGKLVAAKRADRETSEGAVKARVEGGKGVLVCLGCETDFVSRNADFQNLADAIADVAIANCPADLEALKACKMSDGYTVEEAVEAQTGKTGEKHVLAFYTLVEAPFVAQYIHKINGKLGALVGFNKEVSDDLAKGIVMQVASMNPVAISVEDCPAEVIATEKKPAKRSYEGLTMDLMEDYLAIYEGELAEEACKQFAAMKAKKEQRELSYPTIKSWFLDLFPKFNVEKAKGDIKRYRLGHVKAKYKVAKTAPKNRKSTSNIADFPMASGQ